MRKVHQQTRWLVHVRGLSSRRGLVRVRSFAHIRFSEPPRSRTYTNMYKLSLCI